MHAKEGKNKTMEDKGSKDYRVKGHECLKSQVGAI
jgi:hypothetical protein